MNRSLFILLIFSFVDNSSSNPTNFGKCGPLIGRLMLNLISIPADNDITYNEHYQNATDLCKNISTCYGSLEGESAKKTKELYDLRCEKYEFYAHDMMKCFDRILNDKYPFLCYDSICGGKYDFTTNDLVAKRKSLIAGRSCIMNISDSCSNVSKTYLESNYDKFVNILTAKPNDSYCDSIHSEVNLYQCRRKRLDVVIAWNNLRLDSKSNSQQVVQGNDHCTILKQCRSDSCNSYPTSNQMGKCEAFDALASKYNACLEQNGESGEFVFEECEKMKNKKTCIRETMAEKCGNDSVVDFDKYHKWFWKNYLNTTKKFKPLGNYSEYDVVVKIPKRKFDTEDDKCSPFVEELMTVLSDDSNHKTLNWRNANAMCQKITKCYESINTTESAELKANYQQTCDRFQFNMNNMDLCLFGFFEIENSEKGHSFDNSDFFSKNLTKKRNAFLSGKSDFMSYANKSGRCPMEYLESSYNDFVDLITIKPENDDCHSVFSLTENFQCIAHLNNWTNVCRDISGSLNSSKADNFLNDCNMMNRCMEGSNCIIYKMKTTQKWCEMTKENGAYFYSCLEKLRQDDQKYSCAPTSVTRKETGEEFLMQFKSNKECLKTIMQEKCGTVALTGFETWFDKTVLL